MTTAVQTRIAFLGGRGPRASHYDALDDLVPPGVQLDTERLGLWREPPEDRVRAEDAYVARAVELIKDHGWAGVALTGAPNQVLYPGAAARIREAVDVPVITPLDASAAALQALGVRRVLLLTPFDPAMNKRVTHLLTAAGIDAVLPREGFESIEQAAGFGPEDVYGYARDELAAAPDAEGIYFQGARLDPLPVLERLERDLRRPVVASNPAMLWRLLSTLGQRYSVAQGGRLLREWPAQPSG